MIEQIHSSTNMYSDHRNGYHAHMVLGFQVLIWSSFVIVMNNINDFMNVSPAKEILKS